MLIVDELLFTVTWAVFSNNTFSAPITLIEYLVQHLVLGQMDFT